MFHLNDLAALLRLEGNALFVRLLAVAFSRICSFPQRILLGRDDRRQRLADLLR